MSQSIDHSGIAPADARPQQPWSRVGKVAAYLVLLAVAIVSVWFINRRVDALVQHSAPAQTP